MQDFVHDFLQIPGQPPSLGLWQHPMPQHPARVFRPPQRRRGDKGKQPANTASRFAGDDGYFHDDEFEGFTLHPGYGYSCNVCTQVVQQPAYHTTNGTWCFDGAWDPITQQQQDPPAGVEPGRARQQAIAGRIASRDFEPFFDRRQDRLDWDRVSRYQ